MIEDAAAVIDLLHIQHNENMRAHDRVQRLLEPATRSGVTLEELRAVQHVLTEIAQVLARIEQRLAHMERTP